MHITIIGLGPQITKTGTFSRNCFYFYKNQKRLDVNIDDVEKVVFHVKRKTR